MKEIKVNAIFKGQDGSCNFRTGKEYTLIIEHQFNQYIKAGDSNSSEYCAYDTMMSFLENWDNIRKICEIYTPKSLKPEELVDGEIYKNDEFGNERIFRFCKQNPNESLVLYSQLFGNDIYSKDLCSADGYRVRYNILRKATIEESKKLIAHEIRCGYFHELKNQK